MSECLSRLLRQIPIFPTLVYFSGMSRSMETTGANNPVVMTRGRHTPLDYLFFVRPVLMSPVWTIALIGANSVWQQPVPGPAWRWVVMLAQLFCLFGGVYTLNQIFDIESDRVNRKLFFLSEGLISLRAAWVFTVFLNIAALALGLLLGHAYLALTYGVLLLGVFYSAGSRPWKNHAVLGFLANVAAHGVIVYLMGVAFMGGTLSWFWPLAIPYGFAVGGVYLATTVADIDGDRAAQKKTLAVRWGARATMGAAMLFVAFALGMSATMGEWLLMAASLVSLPVFVFSFLTNGSHATLAAKTGVGALTLAAVLVYPYYLLLLVAGFIGTRLFFRWRFNLTYPSF